MTLDFLNQMQPQKSRSRKEITPLLPTMGCSFQNKRATVVKWTWVSICISGLLNSLELCVCKTAWVTNAQLHFSLMCCVNPELSIGNPMNKFGYPSASCWCQQRSLQPALFFFHSVTPSLAQADAFQHSRVTVFRIPKIHGSLKNHITSRKCQVALSDLPPPPMSPNFVLSKCSTACRSHIVTSLATFTDNYCY